ncbi:sugar ABC transporter substrate-binding protein [Opitutaceae bacterium TAV5]|nr:sugar ABC transporter substrate-binding protein [Opitutaceae bacterium TAV5]
MKSRLVPFVGLALLAAVFVLASWQQMRRTRERTDPGVREIHLGHFMIHAGMREGLDEVIAAYENLNPGVRVKQDAVPLRAWSAWQRAQWAGGTTPDIMQIGKDTGDLELGRYYLALSPWVESPNPYNRGTPLEGIPWRDTFVDGLSGGTGYSAALGDSYGIPSQVNTLRLFYNRSLLRAVTGRDKPPATFAALLEVGRAAQAWSADRAGEGAGPDGRRAIVPLAASGPYAGFLFDFLSQSFTGELARPFTPSRTLRPEMTDVARAALEGRWSLDDPPVRRLLEAWAEVAALCPPGYLTQEREDAQFTFVTGRSLFLVAGSWDNAGVLQEAGFPVGVARFPFPGRGEGYWGEFSSGPYSEANAGFGAELAVARTSAHPELAIDFLRYLTSYEASRRLTIRSRRLPAIVGVPVPEEMEPFLPRTDGAAAGFSVVMNGLPGGNTALLMKQQFYRLVNRGGEPGDGAAAVETFVAAVRPGWEPALRRDLARATQARLPTLRAADVRVAFAATDERTATGERAERIAELREAMLDQEAGWYQLREAP